MHGKRRPVRSEKHLMTDTSSTNRWCCQVLERGGEAYLWRRRAWKWHFHGRAHESLTLPALAGWVGAVLEVAHLKRCIEEVVIKREAMANQRSEMRDAADVVVEGKKESAVSKLKYSRSGTGSRRNHGGGWICNMAWRESR